MLPVREYNRIVSINMGLYIHIPFCKQACHYCNFHFTTSVRYQAQMVDAIVEEIRLQKDYLGDLPLASIYFGGGTPSILSEKYLERIMNTVHQLFSIEKNAEITLEANPDDLSYEKLVSLKSMSINRLSIGIQSFRSEDLILMNRAHTPEEAVMSLTNAFEVGFKDVSLDLIYGLPTSTEQEWEENMIKAFDFPINHLSAYALTIEPKTALAHFIKKGTHPPIDESVASVQFEQLMDFVRAKGWDHYEISNFCLPGKEARHNTAYWQSKAYLGIGPSAHSYSKNTRQWNIANNQTYMKAIEKGVIPAEIEHLDTDTQYNECVMTGLRTKWGCSFKEITEFGPQYLAFFRKEAIPLILDGLLFEEKNRVVLTQKGKHFADKVASDLMMV